VPRIEDSRRRGAIPERMDGIGRHFLTIDVDPQTQSTSVAVVRVD